MPTGLKNSLEGAGVPLGQMEPRPAINVSVQMVFAADNTPQRFPAFKVPTGLGVSLRGVNGAAVNAGVVYVGGYPEHLTGSGRYTVSPDTEVSYPADNLCQIWAMGKAGDGLVASVRGAAIG